MISVLPKVGDSSVSKCKFQVFNSYFLQQNVRINKVRLPNQLQISGIQH